MFPARTVRRNFKALSHLSHVCLSTILTQLLPPVRTNYRQLIHLYFTWCPNTKSSLWCDTCFLSARYRVEMSVANETGEALFVCFDGIMTKLHNMRAYEAGHLLVSILSTYILFCAGYLFIQLHWTTVHSGRWWCQRGGNSCPSLCHITWEARPTRFRWGWAQTNFQQIIRSLPSHASSVSVNVSHNLPSLIM